MRPLRHTLQHFVACPCVPYVVSRRWSMAVGLCVRRLAHVVAQASCIDSSETFPWRDTDYERVSSVDYSGLGHGPYWVTKEKLQIREEDKEKLVTQVIDLNDEMSVKDVLSCWVKSVGSRRARLVQENSSAIGAGSARYIPYEQVARTVNAVLKDLGQRGHSNAALQVFQWMQLQGWCKLDPHLYTTVIDALGRSGCLDLAEKIFTGMDDSVKKDTVLYNALLQARSKAGQVEASLHLFNAMKTNNCRPDLYTYNTLMNMYVKGDAGLAKVVSIFKEMCLQGIQPDIISYDILLAACASKEYIKEAQRIFNAMKKRGVKPTVVTYTSMITVYANTGDFRAAMHVFSEMVAEKCKPNVKTFTALINSCRIGRHLEEAQTIFEAMEEYGVKPNVTTYNSLINVYNERGEQGRARAVFLEMVQAGLQPTGVSFTVLMSSFKAAGAYEEALSVYDQAKQLTTGCSVQTYTEALDTCAKAENIAGMTRVVDDMRAADRLPNAVTCTVLLVALGSKCSNSSEVSQLLGSLEGFDSELTKCCHSLLAVSTKTDQEVFYLLDRLFTTITPGDMKTWSALSSSLLDALWALGWYRRAALVLGWLFSNSTFHDDFCIVMPNECKLDVRRLSSGGSIVALYQWLGYLLQLARQVDLVTYTGLDEGSSTSNNCIQELTGIADSGKECRLEESDLKVEVMVPFLISQAQLQVHETESENSTSGSVLNQQVFPRFLTVISGWGKLSKEEGRSQVKTGIEREIRKLGVPFRPAADAGRWTAKGEALLLWLLRPETPSRLVLWDMAAGTSR